MSFGRGMRLIHPSNPLPVREGRVDDDDVDAVFAPTMVPVAPGLLRLAVRPVCLAGDPANGGSSFRGGDTDAAWIESPTQRTVSPNVLH